jgi:hypothetical protein
VDSDASVFKFQLASADQLRRLNRESLFRQCLCSYYLKSSAGPRRSRSRLTTAYRHRIFAFRNDRYAGIIHHAQVPSIEFEMYSLRFPGIEMNALETAERA